MPPHLLMGGGQDQAGARRHCAVFFENASGVAIAVAVNRPSNGIGVERMM
jgi:hypothetical protein